jgi:glyoxylase-like metal-dependent hydrolase (beta-lactamase superfamily II)
VVLVTGFPSDVFGTNCYLVATGPGEACVVVDPGLGVMAELDEVLAEHRLHPVAVLLTHGHLDHTFSVAPVCGARGITAYVHPQDRAMLANPALGLSADVGTLFGGRLTYTEPDDVAELPDAGVISLAGLEITVDHAPGHTLGSVLFRLPGDAPPAGPGPAGDGEPLCLSGDVLFAGSIGRTDLPGGSMAQMRRTLREKILTLDDATVVLPGHGPATTIGRERARNPFLRELVDAEPGSGSSVAPARGRGL